MSVEQVTAAQEPTLFDFLDAVDWVEKPAGQVVEDRGNALRGHLAIRYPAPTLAEPDRHDVWAIVNLGTHLHITGSGLMFDAENARLIAAHLIAFADRRDREETAA